MLNLAIELVGWAAAALVVAAYGLLSAGRLKAEQPSYQWMNLMGAAGLVLNAAWNGAWPSTAVNVVWAGIGIAALVRLGLHPSAAKARACRTSADGGSESDKASSIQ